MHPTGLEPAIQPSESCVIPFHYRCAVDENVQTIFIYPRHLYLHGSGSTADETSLALLALAVNQHDADIFATDWTAR